MSGKKVFSPWGANIDKFIFPRGRAAKKGTKTVLWILITVKFDDGRSPESMLRIKGGAEGTGVSRLDIHIFNDNRGVSCLVGDDGYFIGMDRIFYNNFYAFFRKPF